MFSHEYAYMNVRCVAQATSDKNRRLVQSIIGRARDNQATNDLVFHTGQLNMLVKLGSSFFLKITE